MQANSTVNLALTASKIFRLFQKFIFICIFNNLEGPGIVFPLTSSTVVTTR